MADHSRPDAERLAALVAAHFPANSPKFSRLVARSEQRRAQVGDLTVDQLLNAIRFATSGAIDGGQATWDELLDAVWHRLAPSPGPV